MNFTWLFIPGWVDALAAEVNLPGGNGWGT